MPSVNNDHQDHGLNRNSSVRLLGKTSRIYIVQNILKLYSLSDANILVLSLLELGELLGGEGVQSCKIFSFGLMLVLDLLADVSQAPSLSMVVLWTLF